LTGVVVAYPWVEGIALMTVFTMFFAELMTMRYANFAGMEDDHDHEHNGNGARQPYSDSGMPENKAEDVESVHGRDASMARGADHLGHSREHRDGDNFDKNVLVPESYSAQMTAVFILEFGVIFHSIFIGLTLAVSGEEFVTLYVVLVFHQSFEGLGLGTRLAAAPWPKSKRWTPYLLALGYALSTPIAIAVGLGVRETYPPGSRTTLIVNGVFDSISAGILIYTGLVELMAHEFMFSPTMKRAGIKTVMAAFVLMTTGAGRLKIQILDVSDFC